MSTSVASLTTNFFPSAENGFTTTTSGSVASAATTVGLASVAGYSNGEVAVFVIDPTDVSKKQTFTGVIDTAGTQVTNVVWTAGTNQTHALGATVVDYATATHISMMSKGVLQEHNQDGTHSDVTADSIVVGDLEVTGDFTVGGSDSAGGWITAGDNPDTVTALGNRSYSLVFNGNDLTDTTSPGMRLRLPRTVAAPTQCTSLNGTNQYYNDTSVSGMTFTDDFVVSAWVKLTSYTDGAIVSRYNGTSGFRLFVSSGRVYLQGTKAGSTNFRRVSSYQSLPLNKWVHVSAQLDMSTYTATATTCYVMFDGVNVPAALETSGSNPTDFTQAGNLEIGAENGGTLPFPGKIAQVAIYSAKVTQATILASMNQTLTGSETSLVSAYTFNNSLLDLSANDNDLTAQGSAVATNDDTPFTNPVTGTNVAAGTTNYGIIMAQTFSTNTTLTIQVPEGETLPTTGGIGTVSYSAQSNPYGWPSSANKRIGTVLLQGSSPTATALTQILGMTQTFTADANKEYKITVQPGASMTLSGSGATSAMSIWDGTVGSGTQLMESHVTSAGTNYGAATSVWWTGKLSAGSHTINLGLRAIGAGTTTLGVAVVTPAIFTIEEVV